MRYYSHRTRHTTDISTAKNRHPYRHSNDSPLAILALPTVTPAVPSRHARSLLSGRSKLPTHRRIKPTSSIRTDCHPWQLDSCLHSGM